MPIAVQACIAAAVVIATVVMMQNSIETTIEAQSGIRILSTLDAHREDGVSFDDLAGGSTDDGSRKKLEKQIAKMAREGMIRIENDAGLARYYLIPPVTM